MSTVSVRPSVGARFRDLVRAEPPDRRAISAFLDGLSHAERVEAIHALGGARLQARLYEAVADVPATIAEARRHGLGVGVAFNPESEPEAVAAVAGEADVVLCMSIHPGYSGQELMPDALGRVERTRASLPEAVHVQVDGGIDGGNIGAVHRAGATLVVAGSSIFRHDDLPRAYRSPRRSPGCGTGRSWAKAGTGRRGCRTPRPRRWPGPAAAPAAPRST